MSSGNAPSMALKGARGKYRRFPGSGEVAEVFCGVCSNVGKNYSRKDPDSGG